MSDSDDLPEIELDELFDETASSPPAQPDATVEIELGLPERTAGNSAPAGLTAGSGTEALTIEPSAHLPEVEPGASSVDATALQRATDAAPEIDFEPQFELDPGIAAIPTAQESPLAQVTLPDEGGARDPTEVDAADTDRPVIPVAIETGEPAPVGEEPAVQPPNDSSFDLDAMLSDLEVDPELGFAPQVAAPQAPAAALATTHAGASGANEAVGAFTPPPAPPGTPLEEPTVEGDCDEPPLLEESAAGDAPPLPVSEEEPVSIPAVSLAALKPDAETFATLQKLAGPAADPEAMRATLRAALRGEPYDARQLPDLRALALGVARVLVDTGYSTNELVEAIMGALED